MGNSPRRRRPAPSITAWWVLQGRLRPLSAAASSLRRPGSLGPGRRSGAHQSGGGRHAPPPHPRSAWVGTSFLAYPPPQDRLFPSLTVLAREGLRCRPAAGDHGWQWRRASGKPSRGSAWFCRRGRESRNWTAATPFCSPLTTANKITTTEREKWVQRFDTGKENFFTRSVDNWKIKTDRYLCLHRSGPGQSRPLRSSCLSRLQPPPRGQRRPSHPRPSPTPTPTSFSRKWNKSRGGKAGEPLLLSATLPPTHRPTPCWRSPLNCSGERLGLERLARRKKEGHSRWPGRQTQQPFFGRWRGDAERSSPGVVGRNIQRRKREGGGKGKGKPPRARLPTTLEGARGA